MEIITGKKKCWTTQTETNQFLTTFSQSIRHKTKPYKIVFVTDSSKPNKKIKTVFFIINMPYISFAPRRIHQFVLGECSLPMYTLSRSFSRCLSSII